MQANSIARLLCHFWTGLLVSLLHTHGFEVKQGRREFNKVQGFDICNKNIQSLGMRRFTCKISTAPLWRNTIMFFLWPLPDRCWGGFSHHIFFVHVSSPNQLQRPDLFLPSTFCLCNIMNWWVFCASFVSAMLFLFLRSTNKVTCVFLRHCVQKQLAGVGGGY